MTDAEKALTEAVKEAHAGVHALMYVVGAEDSPALADDVHKAIDRALDLARKVGRLEQAEVDRTRAQQSACVCDLMLDHAERRLSSNAGVEFGLPLGPHLSDCPGGIESDLREVRDRLRRELDEATRG